MIIEDHRVVNIHYTLKDAQGEVLDSSEGREPLAYIQGIGNLIPGLEAELHGKTKGDKVKAVIAPADAYGEYDEQLKHLVPLSGFQSHGDEQLEVGMQVQVDTGQGHAVALVTEIEGDNVTLDLNHPLAGTELHFDVEIMGVRAATEEELDHGHVHGAGGHHH
ncbi:MAG: peptidylprolyl isomerase [Flavobacteriales bacterium]|nr:peptidylprolyl isomerase [Flavobacteriales bacterium]